MDTWMKYTLGLAVPAFAFLVLHDTAQGFYGDPKGGTLSYVVVEPEEDAPAAEAAATDDAPMPSEDPAPEAAATVTEPVTEEAPSEETDTAEAPPKEETPEPATEEATADTAPVEDATTDPMLAAFTPEDLAAGEAAAKACASCHQFERERNGAGPHLVNLIGRPIGAVDGFRYSGALQELNASGAVWTVEDIQTWLEDPKAYAPGTKMNFVVRDAEERRQIAGWLASIAE